MQSFFREVFIKITGMSPLEYRGRYNMEGGGLTVHLIQAQDINSGIFATHCIRIAFL